MRKLFLLLVSILALQITSHAQAYTGTQEYNKTTQGAVINEMPYEASTTEDAIKEKMKAMGYKGKNSKGFTKYEGVKLAELGPDTYDLYFKVDKKGKKDKSTVYMLISKGYDNFAVESTDASLFTNGKAFLNNLINNAAATDLNKQIADQEDVVKKADKKYNNLVDDGHSLEKKKRNIEQDIEVNIKDQATKKAEWESQLQILETLKAKKKG